MDQYLKIIRLLMSLKLYQLFFLMATGMHRDYLYIQKQDNYGKVSTDKKGEMKLTLLKQVKIMVGMLLLMEEIMMVLLVPNM